jgi:hypothetical protein
MTIRPRRGGYQVIVYAGIDPVTGRQRQIARQVKGKREADRTRALRQLSTGELRHLARSLAESTNLCQVARPSSPTSNTTSPPHKPNGSVSFPVRSWDRVRLRHLAPRHDWFRRRRGCWHGSVTTPSSRAYAARQWSQGNSIREVRRCLKRAVARQLFKLLERYDPAQMRPATVV